LIVCFVVEFSSIVAVRRISVSMFLICLRLVGHIFALFAVDIVFFVFEA
jgi:hypothetical protein